MIYKLYEKGYFDYYRFIVDEAKLLSLTCDESIILIKILDEYNKSKKYSVDNILNGLNMSNDKFDLALTSLMDRGFFEIYLDYDSNGIGEEFISLKGFFNKAKDLLESNPNEINDELTMINNLVKDKLNRILTSKEIEIIAALVLEDRYTINDFKRACKLLEDKKKNINIRGLAQALATKEPVEKPNPTSNVVKDFFNSIK